MHYGHVVRRDRERVYPKLVLVEFRWTDCALRDLQTQARAICLYTPANVLTMSGYSSSADPRSPPFGTATFSSFTNSQSIFSPSRYSYSSSGASLCRVALVWCDKLLQTHRWPLQTAKVPPRIEACGVSMSRQPGPPFRTIPTPKKIPSKKEQRWKQR